MRLSQQLLSFLFLLVVLPVLLLDIGLEFQKTLCFVKLSCKVTILMFHPSRLGFQIFEI